MRNVELNIDQINEFSGNDYIINDFTLSSRSKHLLAEELEKDIEEAVDWFLSNYNEEVFLVKAKYFYNSTISRKDIHVSYKARLVAEDRLRGVRFFADIDYSGEEFYGNKEAIALAENN